MIELRFCGVYGRIHICGKTDTMPRLLNIIPGPDAACILLYGNIGSRDRIDAAGVVTELLDLQGRFRKIDVRINSYGGEVYEGIAICNALRNSTAEINIYIDGIAASIASVIALCGKPLHMSRFAKLMLHQVSGGAYGTAEEIRQAAAEAEAAQETLARIIAGRCGMTAEDVALKFFSGGDHWIGAEEALSMGLIDSIYDIDGDVPESGASPDDIYTMTNRLNSQPYKHNDMALIDELRKIPSLSNAAGEQDMLQHITRLENEAAKVPALTARVETLEKERNETLKAAHEALVDMAVSDGRITAAQKEMFMDLLASDEKNTRALLDSMPKKQVRVTDFIDGHKGNGNDLASMTWDQIDRAGRLAELKDKYPDLYMQKFNETFKKQ